jgi:DNA-binding MarR family transcriptional regulator
MMLVNWLEARGLAERRTLPADGRAWGLYLTSRGAKRDCARAEARVRANDAAFAARLSPRERGQLRILLQKLCR